jgi:hypothetical protein
MNSGHLETGEAPRAFLTNMVRTVGSVSCAPGPVCGGSTIIGTVKMVDEFGNPALAEVDTEVILSESHSAASLPVTSCWIMTGASEATFTINTSEVLVNTVGTVTATLGLDAVDSSLTVRPIGIDHIELPVSAAKNTTIVGYVHLERIPTLGAVSISVSSDKTAYAWLINSVGGALPNPYNTTISTGVIKKKIRIKTANATGVAQTVKISATANSITKEATLQVNP